MECRLESRHELADGTVPQPYDHALPQWSAGWKAGMSGAIRIATGLNHDLTAAMECRLESRHECDSDMGTYLQARGRNGVPAGKPA